MKGFGLKVLWIPIELSEEINGEALGRWLWAAGKGGKQKYYKEII